MRNRKTSIDKAYMYARDTYKGTNYKDTKGFAKDYIRFINRLTISLPLVLSIVPWQGHDYDFQTDTLSWTWNLNSGYLVIMVLHLANRFAIKVYTDDYWKTFYNVKDFENHLQSIDNCDACY